MDPIVTLAEIRKLTDAHLRGEEIDINDLVELVCALDEWITGGGFLPPPWARENGN